MSTPLAPTPSSMIRNVLQSLTWLLELHSPEESVIPTPRAYFLTWKEQWEGILALLEQEP